MNACHARNVKCHIYIYICVCVPVCVCVFVGGAIVNLKALIEPKYSWFRNKRSYP